MKKKNKIKNKPKEILAINFALFNNGLFKQKVIRNKKKDIKKFDLKKELSPYLNILFA